MNLIKVFLIVACFYSAISGLSEAYNIEVLPLYLRGWFCDGNKEVLPKLLRQSYAKVVVELGSWLGLSTAFIAHHMDKDAVLYAVDVWEETPECKAVLGLSNDQANVFFDKLYQQFLSNILHLKLAHKVVPMRMKTIDAAKKMNINPGLVYVDASHAEEDVYNDIKNWYPKIVVGGIMCGDDWSWPSVRRAVEATAKEFDQTIHTLENIWWFEPKK